MLRVLQYVQLIVYTLKRTTCELPFTHHRSYTESLTTPVLVYSIIIIIIHYLMCLLLHAICHHINLWGKNRQPEIVSSKYYKKIQMARDRGGWWCMRSFIVYYYYHVSTLPLPIHPAYPESVR